MKIGWQLTKVIAKIIRLTFFGPPCTDNNTRQMILLFACHYSQKSVANPWHNVRCHILPKHSANMTQIIRMRAT